jgi:hypothetical protein
MLLLFTFITSGPENKTDQKEADTTVRRFVKDSSGWYYSR